MLVGNEAIGRRENHSVLTFGGEGGSGDNGAGHLGSDLEAGGDNGFGGLRSLAKDRTHNGGQCGRVVLSHGNHSSLRGLDAVGLVGSNHQLGGDQRHINDLGRQDLLGQSLRLSGSEGEGRIDQQRSSSDQDRFFQEIHIQGSMT